VCVGIISGSVGSSPVALGCQISYSSKTTGTMPKQPRQSAAISPAKGKRIIFDDVGETSTSVEQTLSRLSSQSNVEDHEEDDEESEDELPEAVGLNEVKEIENDENQREEQ